MKPVTIPNTFATQAGPIPLVQLDQDFAALQVATNDIATYSNYFIDLSGAANQINVTTTGLTFSYVAGVELAVKVSNTSTSTVVNINVNALGNQLVLLANGLPPSVGQIVSGQILVLMYNGSNFVINSSQGGSIWSAGDGGALVGQPSFGDQGAGTLSVQNAIYSGGIILSPLVGARVNSTSARTSTTLTNDALLLTALATNAVYNFTLGVSISGSVNFNINYSGSFNSGLYIANNIAGGTAQSGYVSTTQTGNVLNNTLTGIYLSGQIQTTSSGNLALSWASASGASVSLGNGALSANRVA